jgi:transposase
VNEALGALDRKFSTLYLPMGRLSVLLRRAMLLQASCSIRSERRQVERLEYDLLFRWFVRIGSMRRRGTIRTSRPTATGCLKVT